MEREEKETEVEVTWGGIEDKMDYLNYFFLILGRRPIREIPKKDLKEAYQKAIGLAAGLERLLMMGGTDHE